MPTTTNNKNPLLPKKITLPAFSRIKPQHILQALEKVLAENQRAIKDLVAKNKTYTWQNLMQPPEELDERLHYVWGIAHHLNSVADSAELRRIYKICLPKITAYRAEIGQNTELYQAVLALSKSVAQKKFNPAQKKVIENTLRDFRLAGVTLAKKDRARFKKLQCELSRLENKFAENVLDATNAWEKLILDEKKLKGLPDYALSMAKQAATKKKKRGFLFTLQMPSYVAVLTYADNRALRQEMYRAYVTRASKLGKHAKKLDNTPLLEAILEKRLELAQLLGFKNYAELSLATKMVHEPKQVLNFLNDLAKYARKKAHAELKELQQFAKDNYQIKKIAPWDIAYFSEKLKQQKFNLSEEKLRQYFPLEQVLNGMFGLLTRLYKIKVKEAPKIDAWDKKVRFFQIFDAKGKLLGAFYADLFPRQNKQSGAWMDGCLSRRYLENGALQTPVAYLICNFTPQVGTKPVLLSHSEVETLLHEFGHSLQHLLTKINYAPVSGVNGVPWDAIELASQFMENWGYQEKVLNTMTRHAETNVPLPKALIRKMQQAKNFSAGLSMLRQLEFALFDMKLHLEFDPNKKNQTQKVLTEVRKKVALLPPPKYNRMQNSFLHIFAGAYPAGYYSYKWAEVLASDAFAAFLEKGIFDQKTARLFLHNILETGGAYDPMECFKKFRGRTPSLKALLKQSGIK